MGEALQVIGGGKMGSALLGGLIDSGWTTPADVTIVEPHEPSAQAAADRWPGITIVREPQGGLDSIIAVKPPIVLDVVSSIAQHGTTNRILSVAAGVKIGAIETAAVPGTPVVRCMPNTPALVGQGAAAIAGGQAATSVDLAWAETILSSVGVVQIVDEVDIDAVTGVSGSGPAYVFLLAEALIAAGEQVGLSPEVSEVLAKQTILGAATLLTESAESPAQLRQNVTSPNGTTAAGLAVFEAAGFRQLVADVVRAAADRSIELGAQ